MKQKLASSLLTLIFHLCCSSCSDQVDIHKITQLIVRLEAEPKMLHFTWQPMINVDHYKLLKKSQGEATFEVIVDNIHGNKSKLNLKADINKDILKQSIYILQACTARNTCKNSNKLSIDINSDYFIGRFTPKNAGTKLFGSGIALSSDGETLAISSKYEPTSDLREEKLESGAVDIYHFIDNTWILSAHITLNNTISRYSFAKTLTLSADGKTLAVSASLYTSKGLTQYYGDTVYIYARENDSWKEQTHFSVPDREGKFFCQFGTSMALSADGSILAVGETSDNSSAQGVKNNQPDTREPGSGAVYVYTRKNGTWSLSSYIKAPDADDNDVFGYSVDLNDNGDLLAVAALQVNNDHNLNSIYSNQSSYTGGVYIFENKESDWHFSSLLTSSNSYRSKYFGYSLSMSTDGNTLAVGTIFDDSGAKGINGDGTDNTADNSGSAYIFTRHGKKWTEQAYIKASNTDSDDNFGTSLALNNSGTLLAVGAPGEASSLSGGQVNQNDNSAKNTGAVYLYRKFNTEWRQVDFIKSYDAANFDFFGSTVALDGNGETLAVGAVSKVIDSTEKVTKFIDNSEPTTGAVYLF